jgi:hypothetical protein
MRPSSFIKFKSDNIVRLYSGVSLWALDNSDRIRRAYDFFWFNGKSWKVLNFKITRQCSSNGLGKFYIIKEYGTVGDATATMFKDVA